MPLTKNDLKEIRKVVQEEVGTVEINLKKEVKTVETNLTDRFDKKIESEIDKLAIMVKKGFDGQDKKINHLTKEVKEMRKDLVVHDFKMTELVHKADFYKLEERVFRIERKVGLKK